MKKSGLLLVIALAASVGFCAASARGADSAAATEIAAQYDVLKRDMGDVAWFAKIASQVYDPQALITKADRDAADIVLRRTTALLADIRKMRGAPRLTTEARQLSALAAKCKRIDPSRKSDRDTLYADICVLRRKIAFANPLLKDLDEILFIKRHGSANHCCDQYFGFNQKPGGSVYVLSDPFGKAPKVRDVLARSRVTRGRLRGKTLAGGAFLAPDLSFDGKTILFAYTQCNRKAPRWSPEQSLHIFKVQADGSKLEQLTDGSWNEFDPCWLPNGRIVFISERRGGFGRCHPRPVPTYTLFSMMPDGSDIVPTSYHETNEWHPSVNHAGMIIYSRWDYVDRGDCIAHHPWITTPDGRDARAIQGNYPTSRNARPDQEMDLRAIPGSQKLVATASPHHGQAFGSLVTVNPNVADDGAMGPLKRLTPEVRFPEVERGGSGSYGNAWPLSEKYYLCAYAKRGTRRGGGNYGLYLIDCFGNKELLHMDQRIGSISPIPLRARTRPPVLPHQTEIAFPPNHPKAGTPASKAPKTGVITCTNVYNGLLPWPEGTKITGLRIVQLFPKATYRIGSPRIGAAQESLARGVLGTVPVEKDGSVHFIAPAGIPFYFQALDSTGKAVQSMMSLTYIHPGETLACQGCHERRHDAPKVPTGRPLALKRAASKIIPDVKGSYPVFYPHLVQPVLDRKCITCHAEQRKKGKKTPDLANSRRSFQTLIRGAYHQSGKPPSRKQVRSVPGQFGANASKVYQMLAKGHNKVELTEEELYRITLWLDTNCNFYGAYLETAKQDKGILVMPSIQ